MTRTETQIHQEALAVLNESRAARNIADAITRGTTTPAENVVVLWISEHLVLYKYSYCNSGYDGYLSPFVALRDKERLGLSSVGAYVDFEGGGKHEVWNCAKNKDGRLGLKQILDLIERAKEMDARYPEIKAAREEAKRKIDEEREQLSAKQRANQAKQQALWGAAPDLLEAAKLAVSLCDDGSLSLTPGLYDRFVAAIAKAQPKKEKP